VDSRPVSAYEELSPPPAVDRYVECLWVHRLGAGAETFVQPVLPDGCVDLVAVGDDVMVAGPATRTAVLTLAPGTLTVGVRLRTGAAPPVVGASARELRDRDVTVDELWGRRGARLVDRVVEAADWRARLAVLVDGVAARARGAPEPDPVAVGVADLLAARPGRSLPSLATDFGLSERQLRRRVEDAVGYSPRTLARILRFQRFLHAARAAGPGRHLAALAAHLGYADQAHLTRETKELSGLPPAALLGWEAQRLSV
jgi:AraC-like DNA-binding protein